MKDVCSLIWLALIGLFRSRASLQVEILTLRHQLNVLRRKSPQRLGFTRIDLRLFSGLYRLAPGVLGALKIVRPVTVIRWHRAGFRAYWRWRSRPRSGRPKTRLEIRQLIREISPFLSALYDVSCDLRCRGEVLQQKPSDLFTPSAVFFRLQRVQINFPPPDGGVNFLPVVCFAFYAVKGGLQLAQLSQKFIFPDIVL